MLSTSSAMSTNEKDELIKNYDEYEDSVSHIAWSITSPWVFASVSNTANVIINQVPLNEKYKILL